MAAQGSKKAAGLRGIFGASSSKDNLGSPNSRMRRVEQSISLSPAEREGTYTLNPGELKLGDLVEIKAEYEKIQKTFAELPFELEELPKMNPCGKIPKPHAKVGNAFVDLVIVVNVVMPWSVCHLDSCI